MARKADMESSPFNKLLEIKRTRDSQTVEQLTGETSNPTGQLDGLLAPGAKRAKSTDPNYMKFTTYVRKSTHRAAKLRAVGEGRELSEVVEELISQWVAQS